MIHTMRIENLIIGTGGNDLKKNMYRRGRPLSHTIEEIANEIYDVGSKKLKWHYG